MRRPDRLEMVNTGKKRNGKRSMALLYPNPPIHLGHQAAWTPVRGNSCEWASGFEAQHYSDSWARMTSDFDLTKSLTAHTAAGRQVITLPCGAAQSSSRPSAITALPVPGQRWSGPDPFPARHSPVLSQYHNDGSQEKGLEHRFRATCSRA